jgi:CBS domain-containing membrane protein
MIAADIMTVNVRALRPDETVAAAVDLLADLDIRHVPVVDDDGELVGMVSDRDLRALLGRYDDDPTKAEEAGDGIPVSAIMTRHVVSVNPGTSVEEVVDHLLDERVGALPVVDHENKLTGIVSYVDVLRAWQQENQVSGSAILPTLTEMEDRARVHDEQTVAPRPEPKTDPDGDG